MPPKSKLPATPSETPEGKPAFKPRFNDAQFINRDLTQEEREVLKKLSFWDTEWDSHFLRACEAGYRFTVKYEHFSKCFAVYMSIDLKSHPNFGFILTGRGSTPTKAIRQVLFKHVHLASEEWSHFDLGAVADIDD
jgi:hypothetical protein